MIRIKSDIRYADHRNTSTDTVAPEPVEQDAKAPLLRLPLHLRRGKHRVLTKRRQDLQILAIHGYQAQRSFRTVLK